MTLGPFVAAVTARKRGTEPVACVYSRARVKILSHFFGQGLRPHIFSSAKSNTLEKDKILETDKYDAQECGAAVFRRHLNTGTALCSKFAKLFSVRLLSLFSILKLNGS